MTEREQSPAKSDRNKSFDVMLADYPTTETLYSICIALIPVAQVEYFLVIADTTDIPCSIQG